MGKKYSAEENVARFWSRVDKSGECWVWCGAQDAYGYGQVIYTPSSGRKGFKAHRVAWFLSGYQLVEGMTLDHLCQNKLCVNPAHMEQVSNGENASRGNVARTGIRYKTRT